MHAPGVIGRSANARCAPKVMRMISIEILLCKQKVRLDQLQSQIARTEHNNCIVASIIHSSAQSLHVGGCSEPSSQLSGCFQEFKNGALSDKLLLFGSQKIFTQCQVRPLGCIKKGRNTFCAKRTLTVNDVWLDPSSL